MAARYAPKPRKYEMMIVVAPTVTEEGLPAVVERVSGLIETHNGAVESFNHDSPWGRRRLAYPIQKFRDAFYVLYYFDMEPRSIDELDRDIRLDETIIRHLIVKYDPLTERTGDGAYGDSRDDDDERDEDRPRASAPAPAPDDDDDDEDDSEAADDNGDEADDDEDEEEGGESEDESEEDEEDDD